MQFDLEEKPTTITQEQIAAGFCYHTYCQDLLLKSSLGNPLVLFSLLRMYLCTVFLGAQSASHQRGAQ